MWAKLNHARCQRDADRRARAALPVGTLAGEGHVLAFALRTPAEAHAGLVRLLDARNDLVERCCVAAPGSDGALLLVAGAASELEELTAVAAAAVKAHGGRLVSTPRCAASTRLAANWAGSVLGVLPEFALVNANDRVLPEIWSAAVSKTAVAGGGAS